MEASEKDTTARNLYNNLAKFSSIFALLLSVEVAGILKALGTLLQSKELDLVRAYQEVDTAKDVLKNCLMMATTLSLCTRKR